MQLPENNTHLKAGHVNPADLERSWNLFLWKRIIFFFLLNILLNWCVPYNSFEDINHVQMFSGKQCIARFLLPMAVLLPFCMSLDISRKTWAFFDRRGMVPASMQFAIKRYSLRLAIRNLLVNTTIVIILIVLLLFIFGLKYAYSGQLWAAVLGCSSAVMSVIFTVQPALKTRALALTGKV